MTLKELLKKIDYLKVIREKNLKIRGISYHSKKVKKDYLFVAISGFNTDGHLFAKEAEKKGAGVIIGERKILNLKKPQIIVKDSKIALAQASQAFYNFPQKKLKIIGVTGTNGKTSTTFFIKSILEEAGFKSGLIGTIYFKAKNKIIRFAQKTTPESLELVQIFDRFLKEKITHVVMEVSSHGLDLKRVFGLDFEIAVFTGLSREHLDWHKTFKNYLASKLKIVKENKAKFLVADKENKFSRYFLKIFPKDKVCTYGKGGDLQPKKIESTLSGSRFILSFFGKRIPLQIKVVGGFQVKNALAGFGTGLFLKIPSKIIKKGIEKVRRIPGRFEIIKAKRFKVIVDYAHTPDALKNLLLNARRFSFRRMILVFGCGGTRDSSKRIPMGEIAGKYAHFSIITSDNPRFEDPKEIISQIKLGLEKAKGKYQIIIDRKKAIEKAIKRAKENDLIIIAGKGHERYQIFKDKIVPFSDKKVARWAIKKYDL